MTTSSALLEVSALAGHDQYLTPSAFKTKSSIDFKYDEENIYNPFSAIYRPTIKSAQTEVRLTVSGSENFDGTFVVELGKSGADMTTGLTLEMTLPALVMNPDGQGQEGEANNKVAWVTNPAHSIIRETRIDIGGALIERHIGQWFDVWRDLTLSCCKKPGYNAMIGQQNLSVQRIGNESTGQIEYLTKGDVIVANQADVTPVAPVTDFDVNNGFVLIPSEAVTGGALPIAGAAGTANLGTYEGEAIGILEEEGTAIMGYDGAQTFKVEHPQYNISFRYMFWFCDKIHLALPLIGISLNTIQITTTLRPLEEMIRYKSLADAEASADNRIVEDASTKITNLRVYMSAVYLQEAVRDELSMLITQQMLPLTEVLNEITLSGVSETQKITANHPVDEVIWYITDKRNLRRWYRKYTDYTVFGTSVSPMVTGKISFQNTERIMQRLFNYYRFEQHLRFHTNIAENMIYVYSFSQAPEAYQPTSTANFSRITDVLLHLTLNADLFAAVEEIEPLGVGLQVFTRHRNFLRIASGVGGKTFSS